MNRERKYWYSFLRDFWLLLPKSNFLKIDGALDFVSTQIWDFSNIPNFLRFYVLGRMQLTRQLVYQVCYTRYKVSFYWWWIGPVLKYCKVPKYYHQDCSSRPILVFKKLKMRWKQVVFSLSCNKNKLYKTSDYWSGDMLYLNFSEKSLELVSRPDFVYDFS